MRLSCSIPLALCAGIALSSSAMSAQSEKKLSKSDLPPAVQKAADQVSRGATVKGFSQDREGGKLEYEVEMLVNGRSRDVTVAPDGKILEIEEQVELNSLSPQVQESLKKKAGAGAITKIESLTKRGKIVAYEAQIKTVGKHREIQVGPDGQSLTRAE